MVKNGAVRVLNKTEGEEARAKYGERFMGTRWADTKKDSEDHAEGWKAKSR